MTVRQYPGMSFNRSYVKVAGMDVVSKAKHVHSDKSDCAAQLHAKLSRGLVCFLDSPIIASRMVRVSS